MSKKKNILLRIVGAVWISGAAVGCSTLSNPAGFDAYGYLSPNPTADGDFIGNYQSLIDCEAAGNAWMSQQVVGNPVRAECFPVDRK